MPSPFEARRPDWEALWRHPDRLATALPDLERTLAAHRIRQRAAMRTAVDAAGRRLLDALDDADPTTVAAAAAAMAGLGEGLTPAADDFLLGVVLGLWSVAEPEALATVIAAAAAGRTTTLSAAWLAAAAEGLAAQPWHELVANCASGEGVAAAARRIARTGHTSGSYALAGYVTLVGSRLAAIPIPGVR